jgi:hypothetical protein
VFFITPIADAFAFEILKSKPVRKQQQVNFNPVRLLARLAAMIAVMPGLVQ